MSTSRLEAFSDGVLAIIITIMVLELHIVQGPNLSDLLPILPKFLAYILSFSVIGIYWNNHHHLFHNAEKITGKIMWANLNLLFWLSLIPFATSWIGEHYKAEWPTALYGILLLICAFAYQFLQKSIISSLDKNSKIKKNVGSGIKGFASLGIYIAAVIFAFINPLVSDFCYLIVALIWFIPDKRLRL